MTASNVVQLVDSRGDFHLADLDKFVDTNVASGMLPDADSTLVTITVIGARGSGKSTLMNRIFGTDFDIGRPFVGRGTKGCVAGVSATSHALILDTQGSDGRDGDSEKIARIATFALALSDVLMFNLWMADIGRYEAAGYSLLRTVFLEFTRMFEENDPAKTLLCFVIRDHDSAGGASLDSLVKIIMEDIEEIWSQIDSKGVKPITELFTFEFISLPHIRHCAAEFDATCADLSKRFSDPTHEKYLLKNEYSINQPVEGLCPYSEIVWNDTKHDKTVELPSKKDLIAAYRCDVAYDAQQRPTLAQLNKWTSDVDRGRVIPSFGDKSTSLLDSALEKYDAETMSHAATTMRTKKRAELASSLQNRVRALFNKQVALLQNSALQKFKDILLANVADPISDTEMQMALRRVDEWFARKAENLLVPSMRLSYRGARQEVQNALQTYGEGFRNSPTAQLQAMQQMERAAQRPPARARNVEFGLGINAALRPAGFGNFQFITGYSRGPHTMQFTLVSRLCSKFNPLSLLPWTSKK